MRESHRGGKGHGLVGSHVKSTIEDKFLLSLEIGYYKVEWSQELMKPRQEDCPNVCLSPQSRAPE